MPSGLFLPALCVQSFRLETMAPVVLVGWFRLASLEGFIIGSYFSLRTVMVNNSPPESVKSRKPGDPNQLCLLLLWL